MTCWKSFAAFTAATLALACSGSDDTGDSNHGAALDAGIPAKEDPMHDAGSPPVDEEPTPSPDTIVSGLVKELDVGWSYVGFEPTRIADAEVCLSIDGESTCVVTEQDGTFEFEAVPKDTDVELSVTGDGYYGRHQTIWSGDSSRQIYDVRMIPRARVDAPASAMDASGGLLVEVGDILSGGFTPRTGVAFPIDGASALTTDADGVFASREGTSGEDGLLLFWGLEPGALALDESQLEDDCAYVGEQHLSLSAAPEIVAGAVTHISVMCGPNVRGAVR